MKTKILLLFFIGFALGLSAQQQVTPPREPFPPRGFDKRKPVHICSHHHGPPKQTEAQILEEIRRNKKNTRAGVGTYAYVQGIHNAVAKWEAGSFQSYNIGTAPGLGNIYQGTALNTTARYTPGFSLAELQRYAAAQGTTFNEGDEFYINLYDNYNGPPTWTSDPLKFEWEELGRADYEVEVKINTTYGEWGAAPFTAAQATNMMRFYDAVLPIIYEVYGPPSRPHEISIVTDPFAVNSNVYYNQPNHISSSYMATASGEMEQPRLMVHELIHAWRDNVVVAANEEWKYDAALSGFEEGFAESVALLVMDLFVERNPNFFTNADFKKRWDQEHSMMFFWNYDFANHPQVTTEDYWSSDQAAGAHWLRYGLGAAAFRKCYIENPNFFKDFNAEYYRRLNADHDSTPSRALMVEIMEVVMDQVERTPTADWVDEQRILDCEIIPGRKAFMFTFTNPTWQIYWLDNRIYHYETHVSGNEWSWDITDANGQLLERWFHQLNNTSGTFSIYDYLDNQIHTQGITTNNPPDRGPDIGGNTGANPNANLPVGISNHPIATTNGTLYFNPGAGKVVNNIDDMGLYRYHVEFSHGGISTDNSYYKLNGSAFANVGGVFGGIHYDEWPKAVEGRLWIEHGDHGEEAELTITNNAFREDRTWTSIPETDPNFQAGRTETTYSDPGTIHAIYIEPDCSKKKIDFRTIGYGEFTNFTGVQQILLNIDNMDDIVFEASTTGPVCEGDDIDLTFKNNYPDIFEDDSRVTYTWLDKDGGELSNEDSIRLESVTTDMAGEYTMQLEFFGCPVEEYKVNVEIKPGNSIAITAEQDLSGCEGDELALSIEDVSGASYAWTGPNGFTSAEQNPDLGQLAVNMTGTYQVTVSAEDCDGEMVEKVGIVNVNIDPNTTLDLQPMDPISACEEESVDLTADAYDGASYSWTGPNGFTSSEQNPNLSGLTSAASGTYTVEITVDGCDGTPVVGETTVEVEIVDDPVLNISAPSPLEVCDGQDVQLQVDYVNPGNASFDWSHGGSGFTSTEESPVIGGATIQDEGIYSLTVSIPGCSGEDITQELTVEVTVVEDIEVSLNAMADIHVCEGEALDFATDVYNNATYDWSGPNFTSSDRANSIAEAQVDMTGQYTVVVSVDGCDGTPVTDTEVVNILVEDQPELTVAALDDVELCVGDELVLNEDYGNEAQYSWSSSGSELSNTSNLTMTNLTADQSGSIALQVAIPGCKGELVEDEVTFNLLVEPKVDLSSIVVEDMHVCEGEEIFFTTEEHEGISFYSWSGPGYSSEGREGTLSNTTADMSGIYELKVAGNHCEGAFVATRGFEVLIEAQPVLEMNAIADQQLCIGEDLELTEDYGEGATYTWRDANGILSEDAQLNLANLTLDQAGSIILEVSIPGCKETRVDGTIDFDLLVKDEIDFEVSVPAELEVCVNQSLTLDVNDVSASGATYVWEGPDGYTSTEQHPDLQIASELQSGLYTVTVAAPGCKEGEVVRQGETRVKVMDYSDETIELDELDPLCLGSTIQLNVEGSGAAVAYTWYGPDGTALSNNSWLNYGTTGDQSGVYSVQVEFPCPDQFATASVQVDFLPDGFCEAFIPDAFSPNGDGENDVLFVYAHRVKDLDFQVFNRWGNVVFTADDVLVGWDGKFNGADQNSAVYAYRCSITYENGETEVLTGNVTLIR